MGGTIRKKGVAGTASAGAEVDSHLPLLSTVADGPERGPWVRLSAPPNEIAVRSHGARGLALIDLANLPDAPARLAGLAAVGRHSPCWANQASMAWFQSATCSGLNVWAFSSV